IIKTKEHEFKKEFEYLTDVTDELDKLQHSRFNINTIREITLWKLDRYVCMSDDAIEKLNSVQSLKKLDEEKTIIVLKALLKSKGVRLPMASTYLRFINPQVYQIIDARAYRAAFDYTKQETLSNKNEKQLIITYIKYLQKLRDIAQTGYHGLDVRFEDLDRFLYDIDKDAGFEVKDIFPYEKTKLSQLENLINKYKQNKILNGK
ncbi:hypothetical protein II906_10785, partial [bacterium]|nr:hypothetical protein [bacterium]